MYQEQPVFNFESSQNSILNLELPFVEHIEELRQRSFHTLTFVLIFSVLAFLDIKPIVHLLEVPVENVKFFQSAPGEYFLETVKIAFYTGLLTASPLLLSQITFFIIPGLTKKEKTVIVPLLLGSVVLFFFSLLFSYFCLVPAALQFFLTYSSDVIEPLWSFSQYCDFILVLFYTTGIAFQIPILQIILGVLRVTSSSQMLQLWKYVVLLAVIIGAVLTPSTDPVTQLLLSGAILFLYLLGTGAVSLFEKYFQTN
nr:Sec-independent protein translocase component TatC [Meringosphaera mediterranea]